MSYINRRPLTYLLEIKEFQHISYVPRPSLCSLWMQKLSFLRHIGHSICLLSAEGISEEIYGKKITETFYRKILSKSIHKSHTDIRPPTGFLQVDDLQYLSYTLNNFEKSPIYRRTFMLRHVSYIPKAFQSFHGSSIDIGHSICLLLAVYLSEKFSKKKKLSESFYRKIPSTYKRSPIDLFKIKGRFYINSKILTGLLQIEDLLKALCRQKTFPKFPHVHMSPTGRRPIRGILYKEHISEAFYRKIHSTGFLAAEEYP